MNPDDAVRILGRLKAAFPVMTLDEEQAEVLLREVSLLADASVLDEAVGYLIQREERFPPVARIRLAYRSVADARRAAEMALRPAPSSSSRTEIPEWVLVWYWKMRTSEYERQIANEEQARRRIPAEERRPVKLRDFPQFEHPGPDAYSSEEYEQIRQGWVAAGSPTVGSVKEMLLGVGR